MVMSKEGSPNHHTIPKEGVIWDIPKTKEEMFKKKRTICGTLVLDIDGTLTIPEKAYAIDPEVITVMSNFLIGGGNIVFNTGATMGRTERSVLKPLYGQIDAQIGSTEAEKIFKQVFLMPENGSVLLLSKGVKVEENELNFDWFKVHELHVPNKELLREMIESEIVPQYQNSSVVGDWNTDSSHRDYIVTLKKVSNPSELKRYFEEELHNKHPEINWDKITIKAARTSIDFVHADSGKTVSVKWLLKELSGLGGPVVGFGDLGDEFAKVVPTFNVNKKKPNEFRVRGMPAMDLVGGWKLLDKDGYVITGEGTKQTVRNKKTDEVIPVLHNQNNEIIFARKNEKAFLSPAKKGYPVEIKPLIVKGKDGKKIEIGDAGEATSWMIQQLILLGYFSPKDN